MKFLTKEPVKRVEKFLKDYDANLKVPLEKFKKKSNMRILNQKIEKILYSLIIKI